MSRVGKEPIPIPEGVKVRLLDGAIEVAGPRGTLTQRLPGEIGIVIEQDRVRVTRPSDQKRHRALHGLVRSLVANMVAGVTTGYRKVLEIHGVGYRAAVKGDVLNLTLGYSHPINYPIPQGIRISVEKNTRVTIEGNDKQQVGQVAAEIRRFRPVEPYLGKGIRYEGEHVRRKVGKAGA
jgi:large subunit ribosomal protein L6